MGWTRERSFLDKVARNSRKSAKGEDRRRAILAAAMQIFGQSGYQNAPIAAVAEASGLTLPGLLHHFPSKLHLLLALLHQHDAESSRVVREVNGDEVDWKNYLRGLCHLNRLNREAADRLRLFSVLNAESLLRDHPAADWFQKRGERVRTEFVMHLTEGQRLGKIRRDVDVAAVSAELIAMMDGLQVLWLRDPTTFDNDYIFTSYIERLIAEIST